MPAKAVVPAAPQRTDSELRTYCGADKIAELGSTWGLTRLNMYAGEYRQRRFAGLTTADDSRFSPSQRGGWHSVGLSLAETGRCLILLAEATAEAFRAELGA